MAASEPLRRSRRNVCPFAMVLFGRSIFLDSASIHAKEWSSNVDRRPRNLLQMTVVEVFRCHRRRSVSCSDKAKPITEVAAGAKLRCSALDYAALVCECGQPFLHRG
jgi:hypothetical protein